MEGKLNLDGDFDFSANTFIARVKIRSKSAGKSNYCKLQNCFEQRWNTLLDLLPLAQILLGI